MSKQFFDEGGIKSLGMSVINPSFQKKLNDRLIFESAEQTKQQEEQDRAAKAAAKDLDGPELVIFEAVARKTKNAREDAFNAVVDWLGSIPTAASFFDSAFELAGLDEIEPEDDAYPEEAVDDYIAVLGYMADALVAMGADADDVTTLVNTDDEDDAEIQMADAAISDITKAINIDLTDDEAVTDFGIVFAASDEDDVIMEKMIKVVRNGKVVMKNKRIKPRRMTGAQKAALKKNRRKAWKGQARLKRKKSLKIGKKRGLHN